MKATKLTGADFLLILLYLNEMEPIKGAVRLTKMMFLFNKEIVPLLKAKQPLLEIDILPDFIAYNYGPFSKDVYEQISLFQNINFIKVDNLKASEEMGEVDDWEEPLSRDDFFEVADQYDQQVDGKYMEYSLGAAGKQFVESELIGNLTPEQRLLLEKFKKRITTMSIKNILQYVYLKYPEMTENSLIKDEVLNK